MTDFTAYRMPSLRRTTGSAPSFGFGADYAVVVQPYPPQGFTATPTGSSSITLNWTWPPERIAPVCYLLERSTSIVTTTFVQIAVVTGALTYADTSVVASTQYFYRIRAVTMLGVLSDYSDRIPALTTAPVVPLQVTGLAAASPTSATVSLTWTDLATETGYRVERSLTPGAASFVEIATTAVNVANYSDTGRTAGTTYYYRIRGYNAEGNGPYSDITAIVTIVNAAPSSLTATRFSDTRVDLAWVDNTSSPNETAFSIQRSTSPSFTSPTTFTTSANATSYSDTTVSQNTSYYYRVRATEANGDSAYSNIAAYYFVLPNLVFAGALSRSTVVAVFDRAMVGLGTAGNFTLVADLGSDARTVTSAAADLSGLFTILTLDGELTAGTDNYNLVAGAAVLDTAGGALVVTALDFSGPAVTLPQLVYVIATDEDTVLAFFSAKMNATDLADETKYTITPALGSVARTVSSAIADISGFFATLTLDGSLTEGTLNYTLSVAAIEDINGLVLNPSFDTLTFSGPQPGLSITVTTPSSTTVRLTFSNPVLDNAALRCVESYVVKRDDNDVPLAIHSVTPQAITNPTYVDLAVDEQLGGLLYDVVINLIEPA